MTRKLYLLLVGAIVSGALVAACGGGGASSTTSPAASSASTTSSAVTTSSTPASTSSSASTTSSSTTTSQVAATTSSATTAPANLSDAVALCKAEIKSLTTTTLTTDEKGKLENLCSLAGSGDKAKIQAAEKEICLTVIKDSGLTGAAATAAGKSCSAIKAPAG
jgi:hypothetical protein